MAISQPRAILIIAKSQQKEIQRGKLRTRIKCAAFREESFNDRTEEFYYTTEQIMKEPPLFDGYVCGSDQIWNPVVLLVRTIFLDFARKGELEFHMLKPGNDKHP
jgi:hypothetical protein